MKYLKPLAFVFAVALAAVCCPSAEAQRPAHYYPARPTFSNYLLYRQLNGTGIPNYYSYVRPATQYREYVNRSRVYDVRGNRQSLTVEQEVARALESQLTQRLTTGIGRPSVPARFGETSHFYQRPVPTRR